MLCASHLCHDVAEKQGKGPKHRLRQSWCGSNDLMCRIKKYHRKAYGWSGRHRSQPDKQSKGKQNPKGQAGNLKSNKLAESSKTKQKSKTLGKQQGCLMLGLIQVGKEWRETFRLNTQGGLSGTDESKQ